MKRFKKIMVIVILLVSRPVLSSPPNPSKPTPSTPNAVLPPRLTTVPNQNPHPPITEIDQKRVDFAQKTIELLLQTPLETGLEGRIVKRYLYHNKDESCLKNKLCYSDDVAFLGNLERIHQSYGEVLAVKHLHIVPWTLEEFEKNKGKPVTVSHPATPLIGVVESLYSDEYIVHGYVQMSKTKEWFQLETILNEDQTGKISLKYWIVTPLSTPRNAMPLPPC